MYQPIWFIFLPGGEAVCVLTGHEVWFPVGSVVTWVLITQALRDWWTKSSDFAAGQVKKNMYPLGCQLLPWDSAGSIFHGFMQNYGSTVSATGLLQEKFLRGGSYCSTDELIHFRDLSHTELSCLYGFIVERDSVKSLSGPVAFSQSGFRGWHRPGTVLIGVLMWSPCGHHILEAEII